MKNKINFFVNWSINKKMILDLEYVEILRYKMDIMAKTVVIEYAI